MKDFIRRTFTKIGIIPKYKEVTLFLISVTFILLFISNSEMREEFVSGFEPYEIAIYSLVLLFGIYDSIIHVFTTRRILDIERDFMLFFAISINIFAAISAGVYILREVKGYLAILPAWNILSSFLLLALASTDSKILKKEEMISRKQAKIHEVIIGSIVVTFIFLLSQYVFKNYWAITFSLCVGYASTFNEAVNDLFLKGF